MGSQLRVGRKERLDMPPASGTESGNGEPPAAPPGHPQRQLGERADAVHAERADGARRQPPRNVIGESWLRHGCGAQHIDRVDNGGRAAGAVCCRLLEQVRDVVALPGVRVRDQRAADPADQGAGRLAVDAEMGEITRHGSARGETLVPGAQRGERRKVGEGGGRRLGGVSGGGPDSIGPVSRRRGTTAAAGAGRECFSYRQFRSAVKALAIRLFIARGGSIHALWQRCLRRSGRNRPSGRCDITAACASVSEVGLSCHWDGLGSTSAMWRIADDGGIERPDGSIQHL